MIVSKPAKIMMFIGALIGWIAIIGQFYLIIDNRVASVPETIIRFFSYFTILTNIIVAVCYSMQLITASSASGRFWSAAKTQAAVAVYILVVGIVYNAVLRFLWAPEGAQRLVDELLHTVIPIWYLLYWIFFAPKNGLRWMYALTWLWVPFIYLVYIMARGAITNNYPYPFMDAYNHGYPKVVTSCVVILLLFLFLSFVFIAAGRRLAK
jgi:hypothetical protein